MICGRSETYSGRKDWRKTIKSSGKQSGLHIFPPYHRRNNENGLNLSNHRAFFVASNIIACQSCKLLKLSDSRGFWNEKRLLHLQCDWCYHQKLHWIMCNVAQIFSRHQMTVSFSSQDCFSYINWGVFLTSHSKCSPFFSS